MNRKYYRYYGGLLAPQEKWLNKMAANGYRLVRTGKMLYEFEVCTPGQYQYRVEFIAQKSKENASDYARFLEDFGYRVFFKNINLNWNIGKVTARPWAERGGRIAANRTTFNRELLIVEKINDGKPFELHTTYADKAEYYRQLRRPWIYWLLSSVVFGFLTGARAWGVFGVIAAIGLLIYQIELFRLKKQAETEEW